MWLNYKQVLPDARNQTRFLLTALLLFLTSYTFAQHQGMDMDMGAKRNHANQNIYLSMMDTMMQNIDTVKMKLYADLDFMRMMIPHYQGAVEMSLYEIQHGRNFEMIQLAKSIIAEQINEIQQMSLWVKSYHLKKEMDTDTYQKPLMQTMLVMMEQMPPAALLSDTDKSFAAVMIPQHQAGVDMAKVILQYGQDKVVSRMAQNIISSQQVEIEQMKSFLKK